MIDQTGIRCTQSLCDSLLLSRARLYLDRSVRERIIIAILAAMSIMACGSTHTEAQTPPTATQQPAHQAQTAAQPPAKPATPVQTPAPATPPPSTQHLLANGPEFRVGVLYGRVVDVDGKPVSGATVALQGANNKVLGWTKTDAQGEYAIAADPKTVLNLRPSRRRGLLEQCVRAVGDVVTAPVKIVGSTIANPGPTLKSAAVSVATGTPVPLAAQAAAPILSDKNIGDETGKNARVAAAKAAVGDGPYAKGKKSVAEKGETRIIVSLPNYKDVGGKAEAYWLESPRTDKDNPLGMQAWLESVKLAPTASDKSSEIVKEALTLTAPTVEPTLVPAGGTVKIKVKLQSPPGLDRPVRIFAREARKDVVVELKQQEGQDKSAYAGTLTLDPHTPSGETIVTIAALRADPVEVKLDQKKADPLIEFVRRLDDMEANKPYEYDPRIMASANRLDVKLTVLDAKQETPGGQ